MVNNMTQNDFEILTPRLLLRAARAEDAEAITRAKQEVWSELQEWMSWAHDGEDSLQSTQNFIKGAEAAGDLPLIGVCRDTQKFVVATGLMKKDEGQYETGYWVAKDYLGKGLATEATEATLGFAFGTLGAAKIVIGHFEGNDKSRNIIEKFGFTKTETLEKSHARCSDGELLDEHRYAMTEEQWRRRCR